MRTTTLMLKKTSAATIAAAVPSRPSPPSGPAGAISCRKATPTTTVGSTNGTTTSARSRSRPGKRNRCSTNATGQPGDHGDRRGHAGRPHGEPEHPLGARPAEHLGDTAEVERAVRPQTPGEHARDRVDEEQRERGQRHRGDRHGAPVRRPSAARSSLAGDVPPLAQPRRPRFSVDLRRGRPSSGSGETAWRTSPRTRAARRCCRPGRRTCCPAGPPGSPAPA